ncbi:hypothetical protein HDE_00299 [Halotydeus destructor]|nr:hypothetical protein HDE_00299 [Halotydeus destructor]
MVSKAVYILSLLFFFDGPLVNGARQWLKYETVHKDQSGDKIPETVLEYAANVTQEQLDINMDARKICPPFWNCNFPYNDIICAKLNAKYGSEWQIQCELIRTNGRLVPVWREGPDRVVILVNSTDGKAHHLSLWAKLNSEGGKLVVNRANLTADDYNDTMWAAESAPNLDVLASNGYNLTIVSKPYDPYVASGHVIVVDQLPEVNDTSLEMALNDQPSGPEPEVTLSNATAVNSDNSTTGGDDEHNFLFGFRNSFLSRIFG